MTHQEEAYLSLLCLRDSTQRIANLYWTYIELRALTGQAPPILLIMLSKLCEKQQGLQDKLVNSFPEDMAAEKWHDQNEQVSNLSHLSEETQQDLQKICATEMQMMLLVSAMMQR
ncbi:hypothetical protein EOPP23_09400 [Endozoicomonas sp. OPT23]|uniref:hypothetical protein n=1 Tax=Endozoicomonas sp. OPT23 TaxID=2072845 RepID=UPI00129AC7B9|nr:hypothetical protein [Endozoicomonas sp. OPT23]MRI33198.1 hypothetical protein [Endozoicomonas sp. OPT23]